MPRPPPSSPGSAPCQLEWQPSRWQCRALIAMGALMPWALWATDLPTPWGLASGFVATAGTWLEAWRYARRPGCMFVIPADEGPAQVDDAPVETCRCAAAARWCSWPGGSRAAATGACSGPIPFRRHRHVNCD